jgi:hypothetical protein
MTASGGLTETTIRYLFATSWLPSDARERQVQVPGGSTTGIVTAGNLLHIALWDLRRRGLMEFEQLRPVEKEPVRVLGGKPFAACRLVGPDTRLPGLEGALLRAGRRLAGDDDQGVRRLVRALGLDDRSPWTTVCSHCFHEARAAGLVELKGRIFKKIVISDPAAVEALRGRHDELRAARGQYLDAEPELTGAVIADCMRVVADAYNPGGGD